MMLSATLGPRAANGRQVFELCDDIDRRVFRIRQKGKSFAILERVGHDLFRNSNYFVHVGLEPPAGLGGLA
jgi:hypothetical protein